MTKEIYFDMDGTFVDFYGVENWLYYLENGNTKPYEIAKPLINLNYFAKLIHKAQAQGYTVNIISWASKNCNKDFYNAITQAKNKWLNKHLKSVKFNNIYILEYGTPKSTVTDKNNYNILFDDELNNRKEWQGVSYDVDILLKNFKKILDN